MKCEGWTRKGGAFTLGLPVWSQCESEAIVMIELEQEEIEILPGCTICWEKAIERGIKIISVTPIKEPS